MARRTFHSAR